MLPADATEAMEPADAIDAIEPAEPMDRIEPDELIDRIEPDELTDHSEFRLLVHAVLLVRHGDGVTIGLPAGESTYQRPPALVSA